MRAWLGAAAVLTAGLASADEPMRFEGVFGLEPDAFSDAHSPALESEIATRTAAALARL